MKSILRAVLFLVVFLGIGYFVANRWTKSSSPAETVTETNQGLTVSVDYCRPYQKGRKIFGELVPYNKVWRTGANEATIIEFSRDVTVAGKAVPAGRYTLWTIPTATDWTIIINKEVGQWGTNYQEADDLLRVTVPSTKLSQPVEQFTILLQPIDSGIDMTLDWEYTQVVVPIR